MTRLSGRRRMIALAVFCATAGAAQAEICATLGPTQYVDSIQYCVSSALAPQAGNDYGPDNLLDWDNRTAWCEGVRGYGEGQTITLTFYGAPPFSRLIFMNGYAKSEKVYFNNARPRTVEIVTDTGSRVVTQLPIHRGKSMSTSPGFSIIGRSGLLCLMCIPA